MEYKIINGELYHWGTKGMKWGVRRYQNKDGTLTPAGKKRYAKEMEKLKAEQKVLKNKQRTAAKINKLEDMREEIEREKARLNNGDSENPEVRSKSTARKTDLNKVNPKNLTKEELDAYIERLELEKAFNKAVNETHSVTLKKGKDFVERVLTNSGENLTTQVLNYGGSKLLNKLIGEKEIVKDKVKNEVTGEMEEIAKEVIKEVIYANNKKK